MKNLLHQLKLSGSTIALVTAASFVTGHAMAQADASSGAVETVVVTGTNIRGVAPVGSNLITVNNADLEASGGTTLGQMLKDVPALSNFGSLGQGATQDGPQIHYLGASASSSTLTVLDGMRMPIGGTSHNLVEASLVPSVAVQRVDVLADGSSSIYGSDAVAGVVNIITRNSYDGLQLSASGGYAKAYDRLKASVLWGANWTGGNAMMAFQHAYQSDIPLKSRITDENNTAIGGSNSDSFNCTPATVQINGSGNIYLSPTSTTNVGSGTTNAPCFDQSGYYQNKNTADNGIAKMTQQFGDKFTLSATLLFSFDKTVSQSPAGTLTATAFSTGPQANPFYIDPPSVTTATKQTIRFQFDGILPRNSLSPSGANDFYGHFQGDYNFNNDWTVSAYVVLGQDNSFNYTYYGICAACAELSLNGTAQTTGSTTTVDVVGTPLINTMLPLTTANALDVWDPAASNKTSAQTLAFIQSAFTGTTAVDAFAQYRVLLNGTLFQIPGGPLKTAFGAELYSNSLIQSVAKSDGEGASSYGSGYSVFHFSRLVKSMFAEVDIPIISPEMNIPLVHKLEVDISGRYDDYTDVGPTGNPKYAATWEIMDGLRLRGNYSTSFVAPQLDSVGDPNQNYRAAYGGAGADSTVTTFDTALYPGTAGVLPNCAVGAVTCQIGTAATPGFKEQRGIGPTAKPQVGDGYSFGIDYSPLYFPGFSASATLWDANFRGAVTSANLSVYCSVASLAQYCQIFPAGLSSSSAYVQSLIAPFPTLNSPLPSTVYYFYGDDQLNVENLSAKGVDMAVNYTFDTDFGHFKIGESGTDILMYRESFGYPVSGPSFSVNNTDGYNSQFPEVSLQSRTTLGWSNAGFNVNLYLNHTGGYRNWNSPINPITHDSNGNPNGGGDVVKANNTFDLDVSYTVPDGFLTGDQISLHGTNILSSHPPFFNTGTRYNSDVSNLYGRLVELTLTSKF